MLDSAAAASGQLPPDVAERLTTAASRALVEGQSYAMVAGLVVAVAGAVPAGFLLPRNVQPTVDDAVPNTTGQPALSPDSPCPHRATAPTDR